MRCMTCKAEKPPTEFGGKNKRCRPCQHEKDIQLPNRFSRARALIHRQGNTITMSFEHWVSLVVQPCHYCGGPIPTNGRGVDRMDNGPVYTVENCVPCCGVCNQTKSNTLFYDEMLKVGAVYKQIRADRLISGRPELLSHQQENLNVRAREARKVKKRSTTA